jgi:hypothetical protein
VTTVFPSGVPGQRWLLRQLGRFRQTLEALIGRLRGELATTVGRAVGEAVREAFQQLGAHVGERPTAPVYRPSPSRSSNWDRSDWGRSSDAWGDEDDDSWQTRDDEFDSPGRYDDPVARHGEPEPHDDSPAPTGSRWSVALKNGLRAGSWWLSRMTNYPVAGAALAAVVASLGTYFAGPALVSGAAGVCLGLFSLADGLSTAANALNG